jgi:putative ATP-dependent endonuclease of OLD family
MKLKSFSVENYRSITKAEKLQFRQLTVLIGPNNEGKSNILRALVLGLNILSMIEGSRRFRTRFRKETAEFASYDWDRDFPLSRQAAEKDGRTILDFDFELTDAEKAAFQKATGSQLTGTLPVRLSIGQGFDISFQFRKKGRHSAAISKKREAICSFIRTHIAYEYVASVRTAESAMKVADEILSRELQTIEEDTEFLKAIATIEKLQQSVLKKVSKTVTQTLQHFLSDVKRVKVRINREDRFRAMRQHCDIRVNDGTETDLRYKGDGVQSLASIAMIRHASESSAKGRQLILAVEEPETHLHPDAIQELKRVLIELSKLHQVVLTTHNPVLVNRAEIDGNVIVEDHKARPADSIKEIRDSLGVRLSDNLQSAELVLLLEGEEDVSPMTKLLGCHSPTLAAALENGRLAIDTLAGASKLIYKLGLLKIAGCRCHVYMDHDQAGRDAVDAALAEKLLTPASYTFVKCPGLKDSEIEDLYSVALYHNHVLSTYNVDLTDKKLGNSGVWSDRVERQFDAQSGAWNKDGTTEKTLKSAIGALVAQNPATALTTYRRRSFDNLITVLERRLTQALDD